MRKRIPKPSNNLENSIVKPDFAVDDGCVLFSFAALERTEYFNLDGTCQNWASDLFEMLKQVSQVKTIDLISGKYRTYRVHNHESKKDSDLPNPLPYGVALRDFYQIRISTAKGGIHGVFFDNVFYVMWFDPLHNMYPDSRFGGLRKVKPPSTCCKERENEIEALNEKNATLEATNAQLVEDNKVLESLLEESNTRTPRMPGSML